ALDQAGLQRRRARHLLERVRPVSTREELVHVTEREPAVLARLLDLLERVAVLAQVRDEPRVLGGGPRPAAAIVGDDSLVAPAAQGRGRDSRLARRFGEPQFLR